ncbi:PD-(D/E)XK nuclease-like domain-containing protein [Ramlibacter aquaticus]|uniref:PD-(D/E)XK nuclease-like domain-containing protein n=2 Tax=Comamonadaceae TaxID=80864 RepID=A0ABR9SIR2_9BURK|nr:PD-(D/E)XK nuclease-like domain-containing protein [Ramlibacter aquaticus]
MDRFDLASAMACLEGVADHGTTAAGAVGESVLVRGMPAHQYHADRDALSCSMLKPLLVSPAHFQVALACPPRQTDAMVFGSVLHLLVLEPHLLSQEVAVFPSVASKRTSEYKEFVAGRPDKMVIDEPSFAEARGLADKVMTTPYKGRCVGKFIEESIPEATVYYTDPATGLRIRLRMDAYHLDLTIDLKSTRHSDPLAFLRDAVDMDYDLQAFLYSFGRGLYEGSQALEPFVFVAAETEAPYSVSTLSAGSTFMDNGARKYQAALTAYKACSETGLWPDLGTDAELEIEPWQQFNPKGGWRAGLASQAG